MPFNTISDALGHMARSNAEGYVIRSHNFMVKLKQPDYLELHRIVTNLSPKTIWEMLQQGKTIADICSNIPDEFHSYVEKIGDDLLTQFGDIKFTAAIEFQQIRSKLWAGEGTEISRRAWAEEIKKSTYPALLFQILDGRSTDESIWKMIKPRGDVKSLVSDEG